MSSKRASHKIIFDRIEAGTYLIAGGLLSKKIVIKNVEPKILKCEINILKKMGVKITTAKNKILIFKAKILKEQISRQSLIQVFQQIYKLN